jgi:hypothetical protein
MIHRTNIFVAVQKGMPGPAHNLSGLFKANRSLSLANQAQAAIIFIASNEQF